MMLSRWLLAGTALLVSASTVLGADISGKWTLHLKFFLHSGDPWFEFQQSGEKLSGAYHGYFGDIPLTGTVKGNQLEFTIVNNKGTATYLGTINGDSMKGTAKYPFPLNTGKFEGKRAPNPQKN